MATMVGVSGHAAPPRTRADGASNHDCGGSAASAAATRVRYLTPFALHGPEHVEHGHVYRLADKRDCLLFRTFADAMDGFVLRHNKPGELLVWEKKLHGEPMHVVKAFVVFANSTSAHGAVTPRLIYDMLHDAVFRETWDPYRVAAFCVSRLNVCNDIGYYAARSPAPMLFAGRDFVNQRMWHDAGRGEYVIFNTSVPHTAVPSKPHRTSSSSSRHGGGGGGAAATAGGASAFSFPSECSSCVRALSKVTGYLIRPWHDPVTGQPDGACLTYIAQSDLCGWVPPSVTNFIASKYAPKTVATMRQALRTFEVWLPEQLASGKYKRDWDVTPEWWLDDDDDAAVNNNNNNNGGGGGGATGAAAGSATRTPPTRGVVANETIDEALRLWGTSPHKSSTMTSAHGVRGK